MYDWYIFCAWLMHSLMVHVEVQVGAGLMHLFMVQLITGVWKGYVAGYLYRFGAYLMHFFMIQFEVQVDVWYILEQVIGTSYYMLIIG
jgi:hypothetical protein